MAVAVGNVYVLAGVAGLCVIAGLLAFARRGRQAAVAALGTGENQHSRSSRKSLPAS
ncbi:MAG TPA: hypothetical protein VMK13_12095 [Streptosporangiaceae bacterium]|nr:hypothetical protein [Streptosporangiaceae bacterium]